ncbi:hypothetical protein RJ641_030773 [Dillenia turbinata]|uniref:Transmembrane protein n=1 Tax=Dillenia turbinata TaxID=194707 RepID=A0AAN8VNF0_9MAGN
MREPFHALTVTLLSLLLPLSFLLIARLSTFQYILCSTTHGASRSSNSLFADLLSTKPALLYGLVGTISIATLIHGLTGKITLQSESPGLLLRPRLSTAWIMLCTLQVCVGLGIEGSIAAGVVGFGSGNDTSLVSRTIFFIGLFDTMIYWSRSIVKPVVDDTVFGCPKEESWAGRAAMTMTFGTLWWWRLKNEIESLVIVVEAKKQNALPLGVADFIGWWLYYMTVTIGMVRILKGLLWVVMVLLCRREINSNSFNSCEDGEDKV